MIRSFIQEILIGARRRILSIAIMLACITLLLVASGCANDATLETTACARIVEMIDVYCGQNDSMPPLVLQRNGDALLSWRVLIAESYEVMRRPIDRSVPWDHKNNRWLAKICHPFFAFRKEYSENPACRNTKIFAFQGHGTAFDADLFKNRKEMPADLVLFISVADSRTHWMEPGDFEAKNFANRHKASDLLASDNSKILVAFADGQIWALDPSVPMENLAAFLTAAKAKKNDRKALLAAFCTEKRFVEEPPTRPRTHSTQRNSDD